MRINELIPRVLPAAILLAPILAVKLAGMLAGGGVRSAEAVAPDHAPPPVRPGSAAPSPWTVRAQQAADHARTLTGDRLGLSPFLSRFEAVAPAVSAVQDQPDPAPVLLVTVHSIMASARGSLAVIDGTVCREGQTVLDGAWIIVSIDMETGSVTFRHRETGAELTRPVRPE